MGLTVKMPTRCLVTATAYRSTDWLLHKVGHIPLMQSSFADVPHGAFDPLVAAQRYCSLITSQAPSQGAWLSAWLVSTKGYFHGNVAAWSLALTPFE